MTQILSELFSGVLYLFTAEGLKTLLMFVISGILHLSGHQEGIRTFAAAAHRLSAAFWRTCRRCWKTAF